MVYIYKNKSFFLFPSVLLIILFTFSFNSGLFVDAIQSIQGNCCGSADYFDNVLKKFIVYNRTDA